MSGLCKNCRHWRAPAFGDPILPGWGECGLASSEVWYRNEHRIKATAVSYEDADVATAPDFGCNQWEAKP